MPWLIKTLTYLIMGHECNRQTDGQDYHGSTALCS